MEIFFMQEVTLDPVTILSGVKKILLVDWPDKNLPRNLVIAGFTVYGYSPGNYTKIQLAESTEKDNPTNQSTFNLQFESLPGQPEHVDLVCIYRPDEEMEEITYKHVLPSHARIIWIQPPAQSSVAPGLAQKNNLTLVQNTDLAEMALRFKGIEGSTHL